MNKGASKPAKKALKPLFAAVLAVSLCPLVPTEEAHVEEALGVSSDSVANAEGVGGVASADADVCNAASALEAASVIDSGDVVLQADASAAPIVDWTTSGTCRWMIGSGGCLTIEPQFGAKSGELSGFNWLSHRDDITSLAVKRNVRFGSASARQMFYQCSKLATVDLTGLDTSQVTKMTSMFSSCDRLQTVVLGSKFAFEGAGSSRLCSLFTPKWYTLTGRWISSAGGKVYEPKSVPSNVAATYTAEVDPDAKPILRFPDVDYSPWSWYADGVTDVAYRGLIKGYTDGEKAGWFGVGDKLTRGQLATILGRLCATPAELEAAGDDLSAFVDGDLASFWSRKYFAWAVYEELVTGYDEPTGKYLRPHEPVARESAAVVLARAFERGILV